MSNAKRIPRTEPEPDSSVPQETIDPSALYHVALADLAAAKEKAATLRGIEGELRTESDQLEASRERVLSESITVTNTDASVETLMRLDSKLEIHKRKIEDLTTRSQAAETELSSLQSATLAQFGALYRTFYAHEFERQKTKVRENMIPGVGNLVVEQCVALSKEIAAVKALEVTSADPEVLTAQATRLLEALPADFVLPPWQPAIGQPVAPPEPPVGLPWLGRGLSREEIDAEFQRVRTEDRSLDIAGAYRRLKELHPELFPTQAEILAQNQSLLEPGSGVYETKAPLIGDTYHTEEQFKAKLAARKEQFSPVH